MKRLSYLLRRGASGLLLLWLAGAGLTSCSKEEAAERPRPRPEVADQTVLCYFSGQSLLHYFRNTNVPEICQAIGQDILNDSRLLVMIQPGASRGLLIEYSYDDAARTIRADTLQRYENFSSVDRADITRVLADTKQLAPARQYGMVVGSHGGGWVPSAYLDLRQNESDNTTEFFSAQRAIAEPFDLLHKNPGADATRWLGEENGKTTDIATWADAIADADVPLEYLIFDCCFMSNIEALYDLRHAARYVVGSPCEIMGRGMPYALTLPALFTDGGRSYDLEAYCRKFYDYYATTTQTRQSGCLAVAVCEELDELAARTKAVLATADPEADTTALQRYDGLARPLFYDFGQYVETVATDETALAAFRESLSRAFPESARYCTPYFYSAYNYTMNPIDYYSGVTTSAPSRKFPRSWSQTAWAQTVQPPAEP